MRFSRVVRASDSQCRSRNCPEFNSSILRHSEIWLAADDAVLDEELKKTLNGRVLFTLLGNKYRYRYQCDRYCYPTFQKFQGKLLWFFPVLSVFVQFPICVNSLLMKLRNYKSLVIFFFFITASCQHLFLDQHSNFGSGSLKRCKSKRVWILFIGA